MGGVTSKNVVEAINNVGINSIMNVIQDNSTVVSAENNIYLGGGCSANIGKINQSVYLKVNNTAVSETIRTTEFSVSLQNQIQQLAVAMSQALTFNPGSTEAENFAKAVNNLGYHMATNITQNCASTIVAKNTITCTDGANPLIGTINQGIVIDAVKSCVQAATNNESLTAELTNAVKQSATAKQESLFGPLAFIIIIVILGVVAVLVFGGKTAGDVLTKPWIYLAVLAGLAGLTGVMFYTKTGPFKPNLNSNTIACGLTCPTPGGSNCSTPLYQPCNSPSNPKVCQSTACDKTGKTATSCDSFPLGCKCGSFVCQNNVLPTAPWLKFWAPPGSGHSS